MRSTIKNKSIHTTDIELDSVENVMDERTIICLAQGTQQVTYARRDVKFYLDATPPTVNIASSGIISDWNKRFNISLTINTINDETDNTNDKTMCILSDKYNQSQIIDLGNNDIENN